MSASVFVAAKGVLEFVSSEDLHRAIERIRSCSKTIETLDDKSEATGGDDEPADIEIDREQLRLVLKESYYLNLSTVLPYVSSLAVSGVVLLGCLERSLRLVKYNAGGKIENVSPKALVTGNLIQPFRTDDPYGERPYEHGTPEFDELLLWRQSCIDMFLENY